MSLKKIIDKCSGLRIIEKRRASDIYNELVFPTAETDAWDNALSPTLGPAVKPKGRKAAKEDAALAKPFGGIHPNQTMYKKDFGEFTIIAMFWPWQDRKHTTLKLALIKK
jgi:hypothetical protein